MHIYIFKWNQKRCAQILHLQPFIKLGIQSYLRLVRGPISFREKSQDTKWVEKEKPEHSTWLVFEFASGPRAINTHPAQEAGSI